jgi:hypothetical protein
MIAAAGAAFGLGSIRTDDAKFTPSDPAEYDLFGRTIAVSGDTVVVGAMGKNQYEGAAYVFTNEGGAWSQQAKLTTGHPAGQRVFGASVAVEGDRAIIGIPGPAFAAGSAEVYKRTGTTWAEEAEIFSPDGEGNDRFGTSVSISGDTAVVGTNNSRSGFGTARVFRRTGSAWAQEAKLTDPEATNSDYFGYQVAISGDTVIVAAQGKNSEQGAVLVFTRSGTTWSQEAVLEADDAEPSGIFGRSLAIAGDTVVVAARTVSTETGAVYVFTRTGTTWTQQAKLAAPDARAYDSFGRSVAVAGDTLAVGSPGISGDGIGSPGSVYLFRRSGTTWTFDTKLLAKDEVLGNSLGASVALSGGRVVSGAEYAGANFVGAAYVFDTDVPAPPAPGYCLATKIAAKVNARNPAKSKITVTGILDTGGTTSNFDRPATFEIGGFRLDVPQFVRKGASLTYAADGMSLKVTPQKDGLAHAKFTATAVGDLAGKVDPNQLLPLRFATDLSDLRGSVNPTAVEVGLAEPRLAVLAAKATIVGGGADSLSLTLDFVTDGLVPEAAEEFSFCFGPTYRSPLLLPDAFVRKGSTDVYKAKAPGLTKVVIDYAKGTITVTGKGLDLGPIPEGSNLLQVSVVRRRLTQTVPVHLGRFGKKLVY